MDMRVLCDPGTLEMNTQAGGTLLAFSPSICATFSTKEVAAGAEMSLSKAVTTLPLQSMKHGAAAATDLVLSVWHPEHILDTPRLPFGHKQQSG